MLGAVSQQEKTHVTGLGQKRRFKQDEGKCKGYPNEVDLKQLTHSKIFNTDFQFFKIIYFTYMLKFSLLAFPIKLSYVY